MEIIEIVLMALLGIPGCIIGIHQISKLNKKKRRNPSEPFSTSNTIKERSDRSWDNTSKYDLTNLIIGSLEFEYFPLISSWHREENEYIYGDIEIELLNDEYIIPKDFQENFERKNFEYRDVVNRNIHEPKVRYIDHEIIINPTTLKNRIKLSFSKITYRDYLITNENLDDKISDESNITFRDKYFDLSGTSKLNALSNICGVGLFIITSDNKVIFSHTSNNVKVNPNLCSYSAGGTMDWNANLHPFIEVKRECKEELDYDIDFSCTYLVSFGIDKVKGYYQFSFVEYSALKSEQIISNSRMAKDYSAEFEKIESIDFEYKAIINHLKSNKWDHVSSSVLITLCAKEFGKASIEEYSSPKETYINFKERMKFVWEHRSRRNGVFAVLSSRFPANDIENISKDYVNNVISFIGDSCNGKNILEVGGGIGLLSKEIVTKANSITCVDISSEMISKHKNNLIEYTGKVKYHEMFFQDFNEKQKFDIIICSLVLVHNSNNEELLSKFILNMKFYAKTIFLFEPIDTGIQASSDSKAFTVSEYKNLFNEYEVTKEQEYMLHTDKLIFLKLNEKSNS